MSTEQAESASSSSDANASSHAADESGGASRTTESMSQDRLDQIDAVTRQVLEKRARGEEVPDAQVMASHPDLMPELENELGFLRRLREARLSAQSDGPLNDELTVLSDDDLSKPIELPDATAPPPPPPIDGYRILRTAASGGQGAIYLAIQQSTKRKVAIKTMWGGVWASESKKARFDREVKILAALDHPNIVHVIDRGQTHSGLVYYVMDYVRGRPLDKFVAEMRQQHPYDVERILRLFVRVCDAINAAHRRGIVHRDLKPSNVLVDAYGEPHVLDFGLASLAADGGSRGPVTATGQFVGSLSWASPEQAEGLTDEVDARSDVYSLGVLLYHALTDRFPYGVDGKLSDVLHNIRDTRPAPPSRVLTADAPSRDVPATARTAIHLTADADLDAVVLKALEKSAAKRYQSAGELARALESYLGKALGSHRRRGPISQRTVLNTALITIAACLVVLTAILFVAVKRGSFTPPMPAPLQDAAEQGPAWTTSLTLGRTKLLGGTGGAPFEDLSPTPGYLIGFRVSRGVFGPHTIIKALQPIYRTARGIVYGTEHGEGNGDNVTVMANEGYVVGGMTVSVGDRIDGFQVTYYRLSDDKLVMTDAYQSEWVGDHKNDVPLGGTGDLVIGLHGRHGNDLDAFGLVTLAAGQNADRSQ